MAERRVYFDAWLFFRTKEFDLLDNPYDLLPDRAVILNMFAKSVTIRPEFTRKCLVNKNDGHSFLVFLFGKSPALKNRYFHGVEIVSADDRPIDVDKLTGFNSVMPLWKNIGLPPIAKTGQVCGYA